MCAYGGLDDVSDGLERAKREQGRCRGCGGTLRHKVVIVSVCLGGSAYFRDVPGKGE